MKKIFCLMLFFGLILSCTMSFAKETSIERKAHRYDYIYQNPPQTSLHTNGRYVISTSGVRYVHSPSKGKREAHAARINAYNYETGNY